MNREEAITKATSIVESLSQPEVNGRGYVKDGWQPPTLPQRIAAIRDLAEFLIGPEPHLTAPKEPHQHRASCHGAIGELLCGEIEGEPK